MPPEVLGDLIRKFSDESNMIREQILEICVAMQGGIDFNTAWGMSFEDREFAVKVVNKRIKASNPDGKEYM